MPRLFQSAAARLTTGYLAIIMVLSIGCSAVIYNVSSNELERSARRPVNLYNVVFGPNNSSGVNKLWEDQLERDRNHLKLNLVFFNLVVLLSGGALSYFMARRTLEPIEESLEMQKRFTGDASHELRTPLTVMQTEIEVALRSDGLSKAEAVKLLKSNLEEVAKLKELSEGLLTLATTVGKDTPKEQLNLKELATQAIDSASKAASSRKIRLINQVSEALITGNNGQILNLLSILLDNAIKYSPRGSEVTVKSAVKDRFALVSVIDQGPGINNQDLPRIFERFYRADSSRTGGQKRGHGLGLAIAKKITDLHEGSIEVKSSPVKGSIFTVRLPKA